MLESTEKRRLLASFVLACSLTAGCNASGTNALDPLSRIDPSERAIALWTAVHHAPSPRCADDARAASFEVMTPEVLANVCEANVYALAACVYRYDATGADIAVVDTAEGEDPLTRTHELLHVLIQCDTGLADGDYHHLDPVWRHIGQGPT